MHAKHVYIYRQHSNHLIYAYVHTYMSSFTKNVTTAEPVNQDT